MNLPQSALSGVVLVGALCFISGNHISYITCSFDGGSYCGYWQDNSDQANFVIRTTWSFVDQSYNAYLKFLCWFYKENDVARLVSPKSGPVLKKCLRFSYLTEGNTWLLKVYMKTLDALENIWQKAGYQGSSWLTATIEINSFQPFQIVFEAHDGGDSPCDIFIDNVELVDCPAQAKVSHEPWSKWKRCDQTCGANYRSRGRFSYPDEFGKPFNFSYHLRYTTSDKLCPEEHHWYFDNLKDGIFRAEYSTADAMVESGAMDSEDQVLTIKGNQDSVKIPLLEMSCIFRGEQCQNGVTLAYWINLKTQQVLADSSIISTDTADAQGLKIVLSSDGSLKIRMDTKNNKWDISGSFTRAAWAHVAVTWSECYGLTYYENGDVKGHSGVFEENSVAAVLFGNLFIGKSPFAQGALFAMSELVMWDGQISPSDIKLLSQRVDQTERFGFLKPIDGSLFDWSKRYGPTPSDDTGPSFSHLRSGFDPMQKDYKPSSCLDIQLHNVRVDGPYVIYPRGSCGDALQVHCTGMGGSYPREFINVDPEVNYAVRGGIEEPCLTSWDKAGKTKFSKIRIFPTDMKVKRADYQFSTTEGIKVLYGVAGACFSDNLGECSHSGRFMINLNGTGLRVKPTVKWKGKGSSPNYAIMINFARSPSGQEISSDCGGLCGYCTMTSLELEQVTCVKKKPRSCLDVKVYRNVNEDGYFTIYPIPAGLLPMRVFCVGMATDTPSQFVDVVHGGEGKNYALASPDKAVTGTCDYDSSISYASAGLTRFSKIRVDITDKMYIVYDDFRFAERDFGNWIPFGRAESCFSSNVLCMPLGLFNIDLADTGIGVSPDAKWTIGGWQSKSNNLFKLERGFFGQLVEGNCGSHCGFCYPYGLMFVDLIVPRDVKNWKYFGEQNRSLMESTDGGWKNRIFKLSSVCSVAVGCEDGTIPDAAFTSSSAYSASSGPAAGRLRHSGNIGWSKSLGDTDPWLQIDLIAVRLVTGVATQGNKVHGTYVKTYSLAYSLDGINWTIYFQKGSKLMSGNSNGYSIVKMQLENPIFARYIQFHPLAWTDYPNLRVEVYMCPRASYHHMVSLGDYLFVESSFPRTKGERAELVTRVMPPRYQCMKFWYHMTGARMGRLDVFLEETKKERKLIWSVSGDHEEHGWHRGVIPLVVVDTTFRTKFVGIVGDGYKSDVAISGVSFMSDENCSFAPSHASPAEGNVCLESCVETTHCDPITGKCVCKDQDFLGEMCENELLETFYEDAVHYWSFDDVNMKDLKTGIPLDAVGDVTRALGPVNQAIYIASSGHVRFGTVKGVCLVDPSLCSSGLTMALWLKPEYRFRARLFFTSVSRQLGVLLVSGDDEKSVTMFIRGSNHKCKLSVKLPERIWSFISVTWSLLGDGSGNLAFYYNDVEKLTKVCQSSTQSFSANQKKMETISDSLARYSLDELAIWTQVLSEVRIREIYSIIAGNHINSIFFTLRLESIWWHRAFEDEEIEDYQKAREHLIELVTIDDNTTTTIQRIWSHFETDECVFAGFVKDGVASWREEVPLRCNDELYGTDQGFFRFKLTVNNTDAVVLLNNINLGTVGVRFPRVARGGLFSSVDPGDIPVLVQDYQLNPTKGPTLFTLQDCDMTKSGKFGNQYVLKGTQQYSASQHCIALKNKPSLCGSYKIEVGLYHVTGDLSHQSPFEIGHLAILFNYKDNANFKVVFVRTSLHINCYEIWDVVNAAITVMKVGKCLNMVAFPMRKWQKMALVVRPDFVTAYLNDEIFVHIERDFYVGKEEKVGIGVWYNYNMVLRFKDFVVTDVDRFETLSNLPSAMSFHLPPLSNSWKNHSVISIVEKDSSALSAAYSVSANFRYSEQYSYLGAAGTSTEGLGIIFNVVDERNFDFVYYRRNRTVFADFAKTFVTLSLRESEMFAQKLEHLTGTVIRKYSRKVPMHVPYDTTAVALNTTSMLVSWLWTPDKNVTGLFQGFKVLYRREDKDEDSWAEKIVLGREFEHFSSSVIANLCKGMGHFFKVVAFTFYGYGAPSNEMFNSTQEGIPDAEDLGVILQNVDLQTVFVQWKPQSNCSRSGKQLGYIVTFQTFDTLGAPPHQHPENQTVYGETTNATLVRLKHFKNYTVSVLSFNRMGNSPPEYSAHIETLEHVPAIFPPNVSLHVLNSSALNVSWEPIEEHLQQGLFLGYVVFFNDSSDEIRNLTVPPSAIQITLTNLTGFTFYDVTVAGYTRKGLGPKSPRIGETTQEEVPNVPPKNTRVTFVPTGNNISCVFSWDPLPESAVRGIIRGYKATYEPVDILYLSQCSPPCPPLKKTTINTTSTTITVHNCRWYTKYSFHVLAFTVKDGVSSPVLYQASPEGVPAVFPPNVTATALNASTVTVSWSPIEEYLFQGSILGYVVYFNETNDDLRNLTVPPGTLEITLTNLTAFTLYNFIVAGYTEKGMGPWSPLVGKTTHEEVPAVPPKNVTVTFVPTGNNLSCTFSWDPLPEDAVRGIIRGYKATYEPMDILYLSQCSPPCPPLKKTTINTTSTTITVHNCRWYTKYSFHVLAFTVEDGVSSPVLYQASPEGVPAVFPPNVTATALNTSAMTVSWSPIEEYFWQGSIIGYFVFFNETNDSLRNLTVPPGTLEITLTNLTAFTAYNFMVAGYTGKGMGQKSPEFVKKTYEEVPKIAPRNIRLQSNETESPEALQPTNSTNVVVPTSFSTTLEWDPVPKDQVRGVIRCYKVTYEPVEVHYMTRSRRALPNLSPVTVNSSASSIHLEKLLFYSNYSVQVTAYTVGDGLPSLAFHFMTPEGPPSEGPPNLQSSHEGSKSSLVVKWDTIPLHSRNGILKGYHIYYKKESSAGPSMDMTAGASVKQILIKDLEAYTAYYIDVCGFTIAGDGVCSNVIQMTRSLDLAPFTLPMKVSTKAASPLSILLSWTPFPDSYWYDFPRGYQISFQKVALGGLKVSGEPVKTTKVSHKTASYLWSDLTYYTKYRIEIFAVTYRGYGPKVVLYAETCSCPLLMTATFRFQPPYVIKRDGSLRGIIPDLIREMTSSCCAPCFENRTTQIDFEKDGHGNTSPKSTLRDFLASIGHATTFAFPVYGSLDQTHYYGSYGYVPGVRSPGMLLIVKKKSPGDLVTAVIGSIFGVWPILAVSVVLALIAGVIVWMLDSNSNEEIFPRTCFRGCLEGFWWAYISMTTVGYGDTTAKSVPARIFAIVWILTGLCLTSILIGDLSASLSHTVSAKPFSLYGSKVAALQNSSEESIAIRRNAKVTGGPYYTLPQMQQALLNGDVDGVILDIYATTLTKHLWNHTDLRISKILDYASTYGIVFSGDTYGVQYCFRKYFKDNQAQIMKLVEKYTETLKSIKTEDPVEYSQNLIDIQSSAFRKTLLILLVSFGAAFVVGIIWNFTCRCRNSTKRKKENAVHPVETNAISIEEALGKSLKDFCSSLSEGLEKMKRRHGKEIRSLHSLKERSSLRNALKLC